MNVLIRKVIFMWKVKTKSFLPMALMYMGGGAEVYLHLFLTSAPVVNFTSRLIYPQERTR